MDLVFLDKNLAQTQLCSVDGNIYYSIVTRRPADKLVPVTSIRAHKRVLPLRRLSQREFRRLPGRGKEPEELATIEWKGVVTQAYFHSTCLDEGEDGLGVMAKRFMRRRHALPAGKDPLFGKERDQSFIGNDGVKYRWKFQIGGCILRRYDDDEQIARCGRRYLTAGYFNDQTRWTLHIPHPNELTLDIGMLLMTFLWMDHSRLVREIGIDWCPMRREGDLPHEDTKTVGDVHRVLAKTTKRS